MRSIKEISNINYKDINKSPLVEYESKARKKIISKFIILGIAIFILLAAYLLIDVNFTNQKLLRFSMSLRLPKLVVMTIAAFAVGSSTVVFQSIVNNKIVTPELLGMADLYSLVNTSVFFFAGSSSFLAINQNVSFVVNVLLMCLMSTFIYGYLFRKTKFNTMFILLIGTVFGSLFGSLQSSMIRVMDPNDYDSLLARLVASFDNVRFELVIISLVLLAILVVFLRKDLVLLDVITLGKNQATNLGINYDKSVRRLLIGVTICIAVSTALVGPVTFLGLIVANLSREFLKTYKHKYIILGSTLFGILALIGGQIISEHVFTYSVPVSVFISVAGGIYFLYLLLKQRSV